MSLARLLTQIAVFESNRQKTREHKELKLTSGPYLDLQRYKITSNGFASDYIDYRFHSAASDMIERYYIDGMSVPFEDLVQIINQLFDGYGYERFLIDRLETPMSEHHMAQYFTASHQIFCLDEYWIGLQKNVNEGT